MKTIVCDICGCDINDLRFRPNHLRHYKVKVGEVFTSHTYYYDICDACKDKIVRMIIEGKDKGDKE